MRTTALNWMACACLAVLSAFAGVSLAAPVRVLTVEGQVVEGDWLGMDGEKFKLSVEGKETLLQPEQVMNLRWMGTVSQPAPVEVEDSTPAIVHLADGSRFPGRIAASEGEEIRIQTEVAPELTLRLSMIAAIQFGHHELPAATQAFNEALADRDPTQDTLIMVQDGKANTLRGMVESLSAQGGKFKWRNRSVPFESSRVFGLVLATGAGTPPDPQARCILNNNSVWAGKLAGGSRETVRLELTAGPTLELSVDLLDEIRLANAQVIFLSDMEPAGYEFEPWGTTHWPYRKDRSVANRQMQIGGQLFERGIGMHSKSSLTYALKDEYRHFAAAIGIDDAVGSRGNVVFRVLADGREVFNSGPVTGRDAPKPVFVELNGAKTLQLAVDFGENLDIGDQANWGSARLIK